MKYLFACLLCILSTSTALAGAGTYKDFTGSYLFANDSFHERGEGPQDTHVYFSFEGEFARDLYNAMKVKPVSDNCDVKGSKTKEINQMQCNLDPDGKSYRCWFGIDIKKQKIVNAVSC